MTIKFIDKNELVIGGTEWETKPFKFSDILRIGGGGSSPSWQDIILSGNTALTLVNAKANGLNYLKLFGACEQSGTPTPTVPVDIVCNNGVIKYSANMCNVNAQTALIGYYISTSGVVIADPNNWIYQDYIPVKPNTTYTLTMSSSVYYVSISEYSTADRSGFVRRNAGTSGINTTLTITTLPNTNFIRFGTNIDRSGITLDRVLAINWMFNVGDTMAYQPYIEGGIYTDGTVETVEVHEKNIFDEQWLEKQAITSKGQQKSSNGWSCSDFIPVTPGATYTWSSRDFTGNLDRYYFLYKNTTTFESYLHPSPMTATGYTLGIPSDVNYIRLQEQAVGATLAGIKNQLEQGSAATDYVPYYNGGTATAEMLLSVGDYKDVQSVLNGAVTRNVGIKVLDGTEDWAYSSGWSDTTHKCFYATLDGIKQQTTTSNECLCSHFRWYSRDAIYLDKTLIGGCVSGYLPTDPESGKALTFRVSSSIAENATAFKSWLADQYAAGTPVTVVYPLAEPTTESVTAQHLNIQAGTNIVEITQASINNLSLKVSYKGTTEGE